MGVLAFPSATLRGPVKCLHCEHEWEAVSPPGVQSFECPRCHLFKAVRMSLVDPGCARWECHCGNQLFYVTHSGYTCACCGRDQT